MKLRLILSSMMVALLLPQVGHAQLGGALRRAARAAAERATGREAREDTARARPDNRPPSPGSAALGAMLGGSAASGATVDFRTLREMLPTEFAGFRRTNATGQRSSAMGIATSSAEGAYEKGDATAQVTITDMGTARGFAAFGAAWMNVEVDNETEHGFERTLQYRDHKAHAAEDRQAQTGEMTVIVGERFVVKAEVSGGSARDAQAALDAVDLSRLAAMAGPPAQPVAAAQLAGLLPATLGGHARAGLESSSTTVLGFSTSTATATYGTGADALTVTITDYMGGAALASFAWLAGTYENQTEDGFERSGRYEGFPVFEREQRSGGTTSSASQVVVGNRFWVEVRGDVPFAQVRSALGGLDLAALRALAQ